jgi:hypothetical protein
LTVKGLKTKLLISSFANYRENINKFVYVVQINMVIQNDNNLPVKSLLQKAYRLSYLLKIEILLLSH